LRAGVLPADAVPAARAAAEETLNALMALPPSSWSALRRALSRVLRESAVERGALRDCLVPQAAVEHAMPASIGDYTDFFTSIDHATNAGRQVRPDQPLTPNYRWVPIGYHGRSSSLVVSGAPVQRPVGQALLAGEETPRVQPSAKLDFELELGAYIGGGNARGEPVPMARAEDHLFGLCLLNDWSARDVQRWEAQPLGPFLAKNFATTVSPWIVTMEALAPFRLPFARPEGEPQPLPYLDGEANRRFGALDIHLELLLQTPRMREQQGAAARVVRTNYRHAYWTLAQLVAHHTMGGCNLRAGDLFGTGTLSGPTPESAAALLELTVGGRQPLVLPTGETRAFLEDGDSVTIRGWCEQDGAVRIGFGECTGTILPARATA
jgi:fumarylacetoacetase